MAAFNITGQVKPATGLLRGSIDSDGNPKIRLLGRADFSNGVLPPASIMDGYTFGVANGSPYISEGALRMDYPSLAQFQGGIYNSLHFDVPNGHKELYIKFDAKMPNAKHGLKFLKVFGRNATGGTNTVANTTFTLDYTGVDNGSMRFVGFGDGTTQSNDTQQILNLDGSNKSWVGRSWGNGANIISSGLNFPSSSWGTDWHTFRLKIKFNDGTSAANEINNGEISVNIDGVDFVSATGLFNRHWSNGDIAYLSFGDWTQAPSGGSPAFDINYDNIYISQRGFYEGA